MSRQPFVIGERVRCDDGGEVMVVRSEYEEGGERRVDVAPRVRRSTPGYHVHRVEEVHHGHVTREWVDDD